MIPGLKPADYLLFIVLIGIAIWAIISLGNAKPAHLEVWANGAKVDAIMLSNEQKTHIIHGAIGDSVIETKNGKARFIQSPCIGKQCIHTGWLSKTGSTAVCLPNKVSIVLAGSRQEVDGVTF